MLFFTSFGEELLFMVLALGIFWCVDKREGYYLLFLCFFGTVLNQFLKLLCRVPRPWVKDPSFTVVEQARDSATGYSFPSGHTQNAAGTLGGLARWNRKTLLRILCVITLLLTALSRMYLGVHTLQDVLFSLLISGIMIFAFYPVIQKACKTPALMYGLLAGMLLLSFGFVLYANFYPFGGDIDRENLSEARKNSYRLLGALLGFCVAYPVERKWIRFTEKAVWWVQLIKLLGGMLCLLLWKEGLKLCFWLLGWTHPVFSGLRYFVMVLFAAALWPLCFAPLTKLSKRKRVQQ